MSNIIGTILSIENFIANKETEVATRNGLQSQKILTLPKDRKYIIPYFQREIRWDKEQVIEIMRDIKASQKFLGNVIFTQAEDKRFNIIDGQQRTTVLLMIIQYLRSKYEDEIEIFSSCELVVKSFEGFGKCLINCFDLSKIEESEKDSILATDDYNQFIQYQAIWNIIDESNIIQNVEEAQAFIINLRRCEINVIFSRESQEDYGIEYFLDINLKGVRLDTEDIFKAYLFAQDSSDDIYNKWKEAKRLSVQLSKLKIDYPLMKIIEHFFYCDLYSNAKYSQVSFKDDFTLDKECKIDGVTHYSGEHLIKMIKNRKYMKSVLEKINEFMNIMIDIVCSEKTTYFSVLFKNKIDNSEIPVIHNLLKKILLDDNIVPKVLVMKYILDLCKSDKVTKSKCKRAYGVYMLSILFIIFEMNKKSANIYRVVKSEEWYDALISQIQDYLSGSEISERRITAQYKYVHGEENTQMFRCKSLATIYNYFKIENNIVEPSNIKALSTFLLDSNEFTMEHFIINQGKTQQCKVKLKNGKVIEYEYPKSVVKYTNSLFNFIFINEEDNGIIFGDKIFSEKLIDIKMKKKKLSCAYSNMVIALIKKSFKLPQIGENEEETKKQLDVYFNIEFKKQYTEYARKVIDKVTDKLFIE